MAKENNKDRILKLLKECKNHQTAESIAVQLNIRVYFDGEGNYVSAAIERSSGSSLLDNDALALAARSGGATNTTGEPKSDIFYIRYELE